MQLTVHWEARAIPPPERVAVISLTKQGPCLYSNDDVSNPTWGNRPAVITRVEANAVPSPDDVIHSNEGGWRLGGFSSNTLRKRTRQFEGMQVEGWWSLSTDDSIACPPDRSFAISVFYYTP